MDGHGPHWRRVEQHPTASVAVARPRVIPIITEEDPQFYTEHDDGGSTVAPMATSPNLGPRSLQNRVPLPQPQSLNNPSWPHLFPDTHNPLTPSTKASGGSRHRSVFDMSSLAHAVSVESTDGDDVSRDSGCCSPMSSPAGKLRASGARCSFESMLASSSESLLSLDSEVALYTTSKRKSLTSRKLLAPRPRPTSSASMKSRASLTSRSDFGGSRPSSASSMNSESLSPTRRMFYPVARTADSP